MPAPLILPIIGAVGLKKAGLIGAGAGGTVGFVGAKRMTAEGRAWLGIVGLAGIGILGYLLIEKGRI